MIATIRRPTERRCELCDREEVWDEDSAVWRVAEPGNAHCIHEWDINGSFLPIEE